MFRKTRQSQLLSTDYIPSSLDIFEGGYSCPSPVCGLSVEEMGYSFCSCCSRSLLITPLFNLSSCLFGSQRSPSAALAIVLTARISSGMFGVEGESSLGLPSDALGSGFSPSFCSTYVWIRGSESHLLVRRRFVLAHTH